MKTLPPGDPTRRGALQAALNDLRDSWGPTHVSYCRSGGQLRPVAGDPVRELGRARQAELKRLRSALAPTSGTPRHERAPENGGPDAPIGYHQIRGHILRFFGEINGIAATHESIRRHYGGGHLYAGMSELRKEAQVLIDELRGERLRMRTAWERYERREVLIDPKNPYRDRDEADRVGQLLRDARARADELTVALRDSITRTTPIPRVDRYGRWTRESASSALQSFQIVHGRRPTKAECNPDHGLPHYTSLRRLLGPRPLSRSPDG